MGTGIALVVSGVAMVSVVVLSAISESLLWVIPAFIGMVAFLAWLAMRSEQKDEKRGNNETAK